jgi:cobyrinic acid a,c-diamide synthase
MNSQSPNHNTNNTTNNNKLPRLMIAGTHSGVGKTTVSSVILAGLAARGLTVQPFKAGPDYIDPSHLSRAAGLECRNLDPYILPFGTLEGVFVRAAAPADLSLLEGMMGLFDGKEADSDAFSSADLAQRLKTPVVLVLDVSGTARSAAAMALGYTMFAPHLHFAGVILNRVGSSGHAALCQTALQQVGIRCFGFLERKTALELPERHLGLVLSGEAKWEVPVFAAAAQTLDLDGLLEVAGLAGPLEVPPNPLPKSRQPARVRLAIAQDAAFSFYYPDALELLQDLGAELVPFSPLEDSRVPEAHGLYIGGGYPELHAQKLSGNTTMLESVRDFCASGKPVVAECGGLMYLAQSLTDLQGQVFEMAQVIPTRTRMLEWPVLGYREMVALEDSPIATVGTVLRGHEFHYSALECDFQDSPAYQRKNSNELEGFVLGNVLASYLHVHFAADPQLARRFISRAERFALEPVR